MPIRKSDDIENESDERYANVRETHARSKITKRFDATTHNPYPGDEALQYLNRKLDDVIDSVNTNNDKTGITAGQASAITANTAKVSMVIGSGASQAKAGNTTTISGAQASAITANTAKVGLNVTSGFSLSFSVIADEEGIPNRLQIRVTNDEVEGVDPTSVTLNLA